MKEYKIVAEFEATSTKTGETKKYNALSVLCKPKGSAPYRRRRVYKTREEAEKMLKQTKEEAAAADAYTLEESKRYRGESFITKQTNIRIQSRTITEWKDD